MTRILRYAVPPLFAGAAAAMIQLIAIGSSSYPLLWVLPVTFIAVAAMVLVTGKESDRFRWLEYALTALWFVRLVVIPWMMVMAGDGYAAIGPSTGVDDYRQGTLYMAYETLVAGFLFVVVRAILRRSRPASPTSASFRRGSYVPQTLLVLVGGAALVLPAVRERFSFFTSTISGTAREIASGYDSSFNAIASLSNLARLAVPAVLITLALKAESRRPSIAHPLLAMAGCVVVNLFYVATSRASFFVPLVAAIILLVLAFPYGRPLVMLCAGSALLLTTAVVTQNKSFASSPQSTIGDLANYLSTYLMGPKEYAVGMSAVRQYGSSVDMTTLFGDLLGNVPLVSGLVDPLNRTSQFYNWTYLGENLGVGGGYIAPASIQSAFYIGFVLGPLATAIGMIPAMLGVRYLKAPAQDPSMSYVAAFAVVVGLLYHTNSFSTIASFLAFPILPLLLLSTVDGWLAKSLREDAGRDAHHSYRPA